MTIVDAHHHIWRQADLPWLAGPPVPRIFGPYEPIRRDYPVDEYVAEATACGIGASVYVQTNWPLDRVEDEIRWLHDVHAESGWPTAVIGCADLFAPDAYDVMRRQAAIGPSYLCPAGTTAPPASTATLTRRWTLPGPGAGRQRDAAGSAGALLGGARGCPARGRREEGAGRLGGPHEVPQLRQPVVGGQQPAEGGAGPPGG